MTPSDYPGRMIPGKPVSLDVRLDWLILQTGMGNLQPIEG